jgi:two-component sensor histidine kinase
VKFMAPAHSRDSGVPESLRLRRERAERIMNGLRACILLLLAAAALAYAPALSPELKRANLFLLVPTLAWSFGQYLIWYRRKQLPEWLPITNAIMDVTAVTSIIAAYSVTGSGNLALRSPIFLMYFVVLAARPVASSARKTAFVGALAFAQYATLVGWLLSTGRIDPIVSPVEAVAIGRLSFLDEGAKLMLLAIAAAVATYATAWVERLVIESATESAQRQEVATRLVQAQLDTLRLQLSPHFLFNALNGAMALIATTPRGAEKMLAAISYFLRMVLHSSSEPEVTVDRELSLLQHYLDIQRVRFGDRLSVEFEVDDSLRLALVPSLLLQPLVENSIRHGITHRASGGTIRIRITAAGDRLRLDVIDNGVGPGGRRSREKRQGTGLGLANTATRLNHLYGDAHVFETGAVQSGGFAVHIALPLRHSSVPSADSVEDLAEAVS